jgi:hypothetical protein
LISPEEQRPSNLSGCLLPGLWEPKCHRSIFWHQVLIPFDHRLFLWKIRINASLKLSLLTNNLQKESSFLSDSIVTRAEFTFHHILIILQCFNFPKNEIRVSIMQKRVKCIAFSQSPNLKKQPYLEKKPKNYKNKHNIRASQQWKSCSIRNLTVVERFWN